MNRADSLRALLSDKSCAALITSRENRFYFTGFTSSAGAVLITQSGVYLLVDFRYYEAARRCVDDSVTVVFYEQMLKSVNDIVTADCVKSIVIEDKFVTVADCNLYKSKLSVAVITDFSLSDKLLELRMIKSDDEIDCIKAAQNITEKSYTELLNFIKPGVTEIEVSNRLEYLMKQNGAQKTAFDIIAVSGKNSSLPHGVPTDKKLCEGDFLTLDIGVVYKGYHSDMTRTVAIKSVTDEMNEVYSIVLDAHKKARDVISPQKTCADVDIAARDYITKCGYGDYFGHSTGHGVGLEIHEQPVVYKTNNTVLRPNMVITDEPGIYLPDKFGVRIEDMYLVTSDGYEDLANISKALLIL